MLSVAEISAGKIKNRGIVQSVEHQSPKLGVVGSSPSAPAKAKGYAKRTLLLWQESQRRT